MIWQTPDNLSLLRHLASQGKSAQFIAFHMGSFVTRGAVIGWCNRNGVALFGKRGGHNKKSETLERLPKIVAPKPQAEKKPDKRKTNELRSRPFFEDPTILNPKFNSLASISLLEALPHNCRWPIGTPALRCCGVNREPGKVYCIDHCRIAYYGYRPHDPERQVSYEGPLDCQRVSSR